jgi:hypothetical protein
MRALPAQFAGLMERNPTAYISPVTCITSNFHWEEIMRGHLGQLSRASIRSLIAIACVLLVQPKADAQTQIESLKRGLEVQTKRFQALQAGKPDGVIDIRVNPGGAQADAENYYKRIAPLVNFKNLPASNMAEFLVYLGFEGLQPADLEVLSSERLMPASKADFEQLAAEVKDPATFKSKRSLQDFAKDKFLVSRFFAPKIVDFNATPNPDPKQNPHKAGWRKIVRIVPLPKSDADKGHIREAYILMNYFQPDVEKTPFPVSFSDLSPNTESVNNQIILVPKKHVAEKEDSAFWIVYQPSSTGYQLGFFLNAAFDVLPPDSSTQKYFVPTACAQCHGHDEIGEKTDPLVGPFPFAKTNYLDTDQWYDMLDFDFPGTKNATLDADVVFDGKRDHTTKTYAAAVRVIAKLNEAIQKQNEESQKPKGRDEFKILAVKKWLALHKANPQPELSPFKRAIGKGKQWDAKNDVDAKLLPLMDRFCFRCHSAVRFDVFDRGAVKGNAFLAGIYVSSGGMPQGRLLGKTDLDDLVSLLEKLDNEK